MVFQDYLLFPHLSVLENVAFGLRARGAREPAARRTDAGWLERLGLPRLAADPPAHPVGRPAAAGRPGPGAGDRPPAAAARRAAGGARRLDPDRGPPRSASPSARVRGREPAGDPRPAGGDRAGRPPDRDGGRPDRPDGHAGRGHGAPRSALRRRPGRREPAPRHGGRDTALDLDGGGKLICG